MEEQQPEAQQQEEQAINLKLYLKDKLIFEIPVMIGVLIIG